MSKKTVIQILHDNSTPFYELGDLYARLFKKEADSRVINIFLSGEPKTDHHSKADENIYFSLSKRQMKGLKVKPICRLRKIIKNNRPSIILASRYKPLYTSLMATIGTDQKVAGLFHAFGVAAKPSRKAMLSIFSHRLYLLAVSEAIREDIVSNCPNLSSATYTLHNCIDDRKLEAKLLPRNDARKEIGLKEDSFVFANVGRLHPDKGQDVLIRAFAKVASEMPSALLLLAGKGRNEKAYRQLASELGVESQILMPGYIQEAYRFFRAFDAYVSTSEKEPFGMVLTEAQCAALPVISADCGGAPEVVGDTGILFNRKDEQKLAESLLALYKAGTAKRLEMGQQGRQRQIKKFSFDAFCENAKQLPFWNLTADSEEGET